MSQVLLSDTRQAVLSDLDDMETRARRGNPDHLPEIPNPAHIALATVHEMDILLTWNCRHIANAAIQARLRRLAGAFGFALPLLCTPDELTGELYE